MEVGLDIGMLFADFEEVEGVLLFELHESATELDAFLWNGDIFIW